MSRHPFRWEGLAFGLFFLAVVGNWAVWDQDILTPRELSLTASGALIVLGLLGVGATLRHARPAPPSRTDPTPTEGADDDQAADPQP
ncbi:MAG: hypothetical protein JWQ91_1883 [Aeromicrobium sp.]|jgi:uncharacterized membrane protein YqjE|uniref:hypothetical protein n=1 Tax=Aeromicrobium sp. TaxID=1871063 RepID=UPI002627AA79|nr:hypothetical protein [Aeromicrobium sp.]MCW2789676.1 hypothetical protein [Aeromicrobium sp.]MCW2824966.1 hypothetical protein [Aeromicrobium sp.]